MMTRPKVEIADIFRLYGEQYQQTHPISLQQRRVISAISYCRTAQLGAHRMKCNECQYQCIAYNSCRNRHCPKCQGQSQREWVDKQIDKLLPVTYFHIVFTLPDEFAPIALQNQKVIYDLFFHTAWETMKTIAADSRHLGAEIGMTVVLHTWGQALIHHPHLHCIVPGGGLSLDGGQWVASRNNFFLPVKVLSMLFRRLFLTNLQQAFDDGKLVFAGKLTNVSEPENFKQLLNSVRAKKWVVYAKRPFGGPAQVINYLGRYTHRVAISNYRIISVENGKVSFKWRDYKDGNKQKIMTLDAREFMRRFLLHVLPDGFVRIRHYGLLASRNQQKLVICLKHIKPDQQQLIPDPDLLRINRESDIQYCQECKKGKMCVVEIITAEVLFSAGEMITEPP